MVECVNKKVDTTKEKSNTSSVVSTETEDQPTEKETRTKEEDVMEIVEIEEMRKGGNDEPDTIHTTTIEIPEEVIQKPEEDIRLVEIDDTRPTPRYLPTKVSDK